MASYQSPFLKIIRLHFYWAVTSTKELSKCIADHSYAIVLKYIYIAILSDAKQTKPRLRYQIIAAKKLLHTSRCIIDRFHQNTASRSAANRGLPKPQNEIPNRKSLFRSSKESTALNYLFIPIRKIPPNNFGILGATNNPPRIKLQLENSGIRLPNLGSICIRWSRPWYVMGMERRRCWRW